MAESSNSEAMEENLHSTSFLERHRSPSATEIYTHARSFLSDSNGNVIQVIDDSAELTLERTRIAIENNIENYSSGAGNSSFASRAKDKASKAHGRYRSQSSEAMVTTAASPPSTSSVTLLSAKKPGQDRTRTESFSNGKEIEKVSSYDSNTVKRSKMASSFGLSGPSSPEAAKQVVPPLSSTPELSRHSGKIKIKSSAKKFVSRSFVDVNTGGGELGSLKVPSSGGGAAHHATPPRHVGSLRDDLIHTPANASTNTNTNGHLTSKLSSSPSSVSAPDISSQIVTTTPVKDPVPSSGSKISKLKVPGGLGSRTTSPARLESCSSSRSNSGGSGSQLGMDEGDVGKGYGPPSSVGPVGSNAGASGVNTSDASSSTSGVALPVAGGGSGGGGSGNPFASSSASTSGLGGGAQPRETNNIFERRLQEAKALSRREPVEGAVMHEFSLWKNFSNAANAGEVVPIVQDKDHDVAPPKKSSLLRFPVGRASDEAIEQNDCDLESTNPRPSKMGNNNTSGRGSLKMKPLSPVNSSRPRSARKVSSTTKKSKIEPIATFSNDDGDDSVGSAMDEVAAIAITKSNTKKRVSMKPLLSKERGGAAVGGSFEVEDEHGVMQSYDVPTPSASPPLSAAQQPHEILTPPVHSNNNNNTEHVVSGGTSRGLARNFRSMVGSCKKNVNSVASDVESILSEHSVDITDPFSMHRSVADSIESSVHSNYEREVFEDDNELAIFGVVHDHDDDVDLSFISEDDTCDMYQLHDDHENESMVGDGLDEHCHIKRILILSKDEEEEDLLDESVDSTGQDGDSLLLSQSHEHSGSGSINHVPFSPRALDGQEEEEGRDSVPPPIAKSRGGKASSFSSDFFEGSVDQSAEVVNTSASFGSESSALSLKPLLVTALSAAQSSVIRVPALASHLLSKNKSKNVQNPGEQIIAASPPSSSRMSTERTTERYSKLNSKNQCENGFNVNTSTCVMSATLGNPPPLLKANLQAKHAIKRSTFQDKCSIESKHRSKKSTKSRAEHKSKVHASKERRANNPSPHAPTPHISTSELDTQDPVVQEGAGRGRDERVNDSDDDESVTSELSEMSTSSNENFNSDDPFPMTEAEREELQLQQHKQYLQLGGMGHLAKQGALTAPAVLRSPDTLERANSISGSIEAAQLKYSQTEDSQDDQMHKLDTGLQWKKGNDVLGHGSFGQVYKGMNLDTGELLAVKQICLNDGTEGEVVLLRKEIDVMKDLSHPNIVRYVGTSISPRYLFIVLEYVPGGSVAGTLSQFGAFSEPLIRRFVSQIITGVNYLHDKQIIHRDIKGANVLVTDAGIAKLADFGCSKQLGGMVTASLEESMRIIRGSVPWMAPEVIKQVGHGRSADLWSVGATMIEMATAKHPWPEFSNNLAALFHVATSKDPPPIPGHLSPACAAFMSRCLVIDPKDRATAHDLIGDPFLLSSAPSAVLASNS